MIEDDSESSYIEQHHFSTSLDFVTETNYKKIPNDSAEKHKQQDRRIFASSSGPILSEQSEDQEAVESTILETTTFRIVAAELPQSYGEKNPKVGREIVGNSKNELGHSANSFHGVGTVGNIFTKSKIRNEVNGYSDRGFLSVRKNGKWGKLCLSGIDNLLEEKRTAWTIEDLGRAVCKAVTYQ